MVERRSARGEDGDEVGATIYHNLRMNCCYFLKEAAVYHEKAFKKTNLRVGISCVISFHYIGKMVLLIARLRWYGRNSFHHHSATCACIFSPIFQSKRISFLKGVSVAQP